MATILIEGVNWDGLDVIVLLLRCYYYIIIVIMIVTNLIFESLIHAIFDLLFSSMHFTS